MGLLYSVEFHATIEPSTTKRRNQMAYATTVNTLTQYQVRELFNACWRMLENGEDYTYGFEHSVAYAYYNEERDCMEAWLADGNPNMYEAVKYEYLCSYKP